VVVFKLAGCSALEAVGFCTLHHIGEVSVQIHLNVSLLLWHSGL
jgi:hypothetical protein